jgi:hypothetical protein
MQQFTVPQFIDSEDKIIGPLSVRQFILSICAFLLIALFYKIFDFTLFLLLSIFDVFIFGLFAFIKVNGMPFHFFILNVIQTLKKPSLRIWNKGINFSFSFEENILEKRKIYEGKDFSVSRLNQLSLIVDTQGSFQNVNEDESVFTLDEDVSEYSLENKTRKNKI